MQKAPRTLKNFVCSALIGGMLLSFGGVAYAADTEPSNSIKSGTVKECPYKKGHHKNFSPEKMKVRLQNRLAPLVKSGELSQEKADKVVEYFYKNAVERKAKWKKAKAMQPEERREYIKKLKAERKRPLVELVKDGVITQKEADCVKKVLPKRGHHKKS